MKKRRRKNPLSAAAKARWKKAGSLAWRGTKAVGRVAGKTAYHTTRIAGKSAYAAGRVAALETKGLICRAKNPRAYWVEVNGVRKILFNDRKKVFKYARAYAKLHPTAKVRVLRA